MNKIKQTENNSHEHLVDTKIIKNFLAFQQSDTVDKVKEILGAGARRFETIGYVYVVNETGILIVVSLKHLLEAPPNTKLGDIMNTDVISVKYHSHQE